MEKSLSQPHVCPYVGEIKETKQELKKTRQDVKDIKTAILGQDGTGMKEGIVHEISELKSKERVNTSWTGTVKPIIIAVVTALVTYGLTRLPF